MRNFHLKLLSLKEHAEQLQLDISMLKKEKEEVGKDKDRIIDSYEEEIDNSIAIIKALE